MCSKYCILYSLRDYKSNSCCMLPVFVNFPSNEEEWQNVANGFWHNWQLSHCIGAINDYNFSVVDIGAEGSQSDGGVFNDPELDKRLKENSLSIPPSSYLADTKICMPYFLTDDAAFPIKKYLMKPYTRRSNSHEEAVFNYRLSRARR